jgi:hypothetical protein
LSGTRESIDNTTQGEEVAAILPGQTDPDTGQDQTAVDDTTEQTKPEADDAGQAKAESEAQKRIARAEFERREARRQVRELQARLDAQAQANPPAAGSPEEWQARVAKAAAEQVRIDKFNARANEINDAGVSEFPDFGQAVASLNKIGLPTELIEAADEAGDPHKILYYLGMNPDEQERILTLSPSRMGAALAKLAGKAIAPPPPAPVSRAPAPVTTVTGISRTQPVLDRDDMDPDAYLKAFRARGRRSG